MRHLCGNGLKIYNCSKLGLLGFPVAICGFDREFLTAPIYLEKSICHLEYTG